MSGSSGRLEIQDPRFGGYGNVPIGAETGRTMNRFMLMSRLGLAEPLVRLERRVERWNRQAAQRPPVQRSVTSVRPAKRAA
jgi:hypothetical protein